MLIPHTDQCQKWAEQLSGADVPVLDATREALAAWRRVPDRVDAHSIADIVLRDPLMTLRVLVHVSNGLGRRLSMPVSTVTAGLVLMGIEPFYRDFSDLPSLEERLAAHPGALAGALQTMERAHQAATLAASIAIEQQDANVEAVHEAALLANVGRLLLWCEAPALALALQDSRRENITASHEELERELLGVELRALGDMLMERWGLGHMLGITPAPAMALALRLE